MEHRSGKSYSSDSSLLNLYFIQSLKLDLSISFCLPLTALAFVILTGTCLQKTQGAIYKEHWGLIYKKGNSWNYRAVILSLQYFVRQMGILTVTIRFMVLSMSCNHLLLLERRAGCNASLV